MKLFIKELVGRLFSKVFSLIEDELRKRKTQELKKSNVRLKVSIQSCGFNVKLNGRIFVSNTQTLSIGNNIHIGDNAYLKTEGGLTIGDNTHISRNLTVYTVNHEYEGTALPYDNDFHLKPVSIGKNVWIGMNVNLIPGIRVGNGAIIAMGSTVTKDVPAHSIIGGAPAIIIKNRDTNHYLHLEREKRFGGVDGRLYSPSSSTNFLPHGNEKEDSIFFILTTGRSGSTSIAKSLNKHPNISCHHEPRQQLVRLSTELAHGLKDQDAVLEELHDIYIKSATFPPGIYGESDQKFFNLVPLLHELMPKAKFIWLIRDGRDVVASTYARGWFSDDEYDIEEEPYSLKIWKKYRLHGGKSKAFNNKEWSNITLFERNCWYWAYVNQTIDDALTSIPQQQQIKLTLDELNNGYNKLFNFLNVTHLPIKNMVTNKSRPNEDPFNKNQWSQNYENMFIQHCGPGMKKWMEKL